jgi:transcriptional regulator GlxA family with amidase domain
VNSRLDSIKDWPERAARSHFRIDVLAEDCRVGVRQLSRYFHVRFGEAPHLWTTRRRLLKALDLLLEGRSVNEIAVALGYSDHAHFSEVFKAHCGVSPRSFRHLDAESRAKVRLAIEKSD